MSFRRVAAGLFLAVACAALPASGGRPLAVDDADPVEPGFVEVEAGVAGEEDGSDRAGSADFGFSVGIVPNVEAGIAFGGLRVEADGEERTGFGDTIIGLKWRFAGSDSPFRQALAPAVKLPTADEDEGLGSGETDAELTWIASCAVSETVGPHVNAGYTWVGDTNEEPAGDVAYYGVAADCLCGESFQLVAEIFAEDERESGADTAVVGNLGLRWFASDAVTADAAVSAPLDGEGPDFAATVGVTWLFGTVE